MAFGAADSELEDTQTQTQSGLTNRNDKYLLIYTRRVYQAFRQVFRIATRAPRTQYPYIHIHKYLLILAWRIY